MRIVGGALRGRKLLSPSGNATRPTSDRARESIFNILAHAKWLEDEILEDQPVMDVFAGTGALGLEALSRGAKHCIFIESERTAAKNCSDNIESLGIDDAQARVLTADALKPPALPPGVDPRKLVFLDPPYGKGMGAAALSALAAKGWFAKGAVCVLEMEKKKPEAAPEGFALLDERAYGIALVRFFRWQG